jgi:hypothetical protein
MNEENEHIKNTLFQIIKDIRESTVNNIFYTIKNIKYIFDKVEYLSSLCTFENFVKINISDYNSVNNYKNKIYLPSNYIKCKNDYDCYFKVRLKITDSEFLYAFILSIIDEDVKKVYKQINVLIPDFLSRGVYNALRAINSSKFIFDDKLDKGIITKRVIKDRYGNIIDIEYEEDYSLYEVIYGNNKNEINDDIYTESDNEDDI